MADNAVPDRVSHTHVVPGNIMSVEFKLFDVMTLKQFLYLVVCAFLSYLFITILPDNFIKWILPAVIMMAGIVVAFVQFNGESFEIYTTNFILGVIQPQRRVWSKIPVVKKTISSTDNTTETASKKAISDLNENYVAEQEVIPVDYNKGVTSMDAAEQRFLRSTSVADTKYTSSNAIAKADLSKLNFDFIKDIEKVKDNVVENKVNLLEATVNLGGTGQVQLNNQSSVIKDTDSQQNKNLDLNTSNMNPQKNIFGQSNISATSPAFTINMDDDDLNKKNDNVVFDVSSGINQHTNPLKIDLDDESDNDIHPSNANSTFTSQNLSQNVTTLPVDNVAHESLITAFPEIKNNPLLEHSNNQHVDETIVSSTNDLNQSNIPNNVPQIIDIPVEQPISNNAPAIQIVDIPAVDSLPLPVNNSVRPNQEIPFNTNPIVNSIQPTVMPASDMSKIHGKVISADMISMSGLAIIMFDNAGKALESVITNEHGEFVFSIIPKSFEIKIHSPKKFLFSPMDKATREIIIHEIPTGNTQGTFSTIFKQDKDALINISKLNDVTEMDTSETKIPNTINGVVKDEMGHYLAGVLVSIKDSSDATIRALATNPLGQFFSHSPLQNGTYNISLEKDGYRFENYVTTLEGQIYTSKIYIGKNENIQTV